MVISLNILHNLKVHELEKLIKEIQRVGKKSYIMVEVYRNEELFNLQCWALTAETFLLQNGNGYLRNAIMETLSTYIFND